VLVQWQEDGSKAATWEDVSTIKDQFSEFNLGDKVVLAAVGNIRQGNNERVELCHRKKFKNK